MIQLDLRVLPLVTALIFLLMAGAMLLLRRIGPDHRSANYWALGNTLIAAGVFFIALRGLIPLFFSVPTANLCIVAGQGFLLTGIWNFFGRPVRWWAVVGVAVSDFLILFFYTYIVPDAGIRIIIGSIFIAVICAWICRELVREFDPQLGLPQGLVALVFFLYTLFMVIRAVATGVAEEPPDLMMTSPVHTYAFVLGMVSIIAVTFGFSAMINRRLHLDLEQLANYDQLTGVRTRRAFEEEIERELSRCRRQGGRFSVLLMDLDHFKRINDRYGHIAGDKVLQGVTGVAQRNLRTEDALGRIGGEEFCAILPNTESAAAREVAERIRRTIGDLVVPHKGQAIQVTVSIGITTVDRSAQNWEAVFHEADQALYRAKEQGRDRIET